MLDLRLAQRLVAVPYRHTETSVRNHHYTLTAQKNGILFCRMAVFSDLRAGRALSGRKLFGTHLVLEAEWAPGILNADRPPTPVL